MSKFEQKLDEAISKFVKLEVKPIGGEDPNPDGVKLEGDKKKSADGAHRPDPGTDYTRLTTDTGPNFQNLSHDYSDQARPGLSD